MEEKNAEEMRALNVDEKPASPKTSKYGEPSPDTPSSSKCRCCTVCCSRLYSCCKPCMTEYNERPDPDDPCAPKVRYACLCPPHGRIARIITLATSVLLIWGTLWALTGDEALPGGNFFGIFALLVLCTLGGELVKLMHLPPLLGMLIVGCLLRNVPVVNVAKDIHPMWSGSLRSIALVVILIRAGLGLDPVALKKLSFAVFRLAFLPCLAETVTAAIASHLLLGFPWVWGIMLGFILAAVSPAVVVPCMLQLTEKGLGVEQGIPTLIIAAASVDDVLAISGFGVVLGITFSSGQLWVTIIKGPLEAILGLVYGIVFGIFLWYIPHKKHSQQTLFRLILLLFGGLFAMFGSTKADLAGAGALGCLSLAFVAAMRWRKELQTPEGEDEVELPVSLLMGFIWIIFQPLLFGLIGAEIDITTIQPKTIGLGIAVLAIGLSVRLVVSFCAVLGAGLSMREKLFIPLAWLPKATVQAAIGSVALDTARLKNSDQSQIDLGIQVVTIAVLVILITAPLGALAITLSAPRLLRKVSNVIVDIGDIGPEDTPLQSGSSRQGDVVSNEEDGGDIMNHEDAKSKVV